MVNSAGRQDVLIESDSLILTNVINKLKNLCSSVGSIIEDCYNLLSALVNSKLIFVRRSMNAVAHSIVRVLRSLSGQQEWCDVCSAFLFDILSSDLI